MKKIKAVLMADNVPFYDGDIVEYVYGAERINKIREMTDFHPVRINSGNLEAELSKLNETEVIFTCWGMPKLTTAQIERMPKLKAVFYAGGSVNGFARPYLERGIAVCTAVEANAIPVAEFCLAQILLACKGAYHNSQLCRRGPWKQGEMQVGRGVYGETVALVGIGAVSRHLLKLLSQFNLRVIAVEPNDYLEKPPFNGHEAVGISTMVSIEEAFQQAYVVSNHLPDKAENKKIFTKKHFASLRQEATFINSGRGAQVDEAGMIEVLKARPDLTALLDVQHPEPPEAGSELYSLPNVHMTSHIAGSTNDEVHRMADFMIEDFQRYANGEKLKYAVNPDDFTGRA